METRTVHAIRIQLHTVADRSVIIWPKDTSKLGVQLMNPRRTWMTARSGDAVILTSDGTKNREPIEAVELYACFRRPIMARWLNRRGNGSTRETLL